MANPPTTYKQDIADLADHIIKVNGGGDYRKERSKIAEKHNLNIAEVNGSLSAHVQEATSPDKYARLKDATNGILH